MATIILAWEYNKDPFSLQKFFSLQDELILRGHKVYLVGVNLPSHDNARRPFLPAPTAGSPLIHKPRGIIKIGGFSDRLVLLGFNNPHLLYTLANCWEHIYTLLKPNLLIADCAPVASLVAQGLIPIIQVTDGFSLPPSHLMEFPRLRPDVPPLATSESILHNIQSVQEKRRKPISFDFACLFESEANFICHLPHFDPYFSLRKGNVTYGSFNNLPSLNLMQPRQYFFAHLDLNYPDIEEIIISLTQLEQKGFYYIPDLPASLRIFLTSKGGMLIDNLVDFEKVLLQCSFVVHHGNLTIAESALCAGILQFSIPYNFESDWLANLLNKLNVGLSIYSAINPIEALARTIKENWNRLSLKEWAILRAQHLQQQNYKPIQEMILDACSYILRDLSCVPHI